MKLIKLTKHLNSPVHLELWYSHHDDYIIHLITGYFHVIMTDLLWWWQQCAAVHYVWLTITHGGQHDQGRLFLDISNKLNFRLVSERHMQPVKVLPFIEILLLRCLKRNSLGKSCFSLILSNQTNKREISRLWDPGVLFYSLRTWFYYTTVNKNIPPVVLIQEKMLQLLPLYIMMYMGV